MKSVVMGLAGLAAFSVSSQVMAEAPNLEISGLVEVEASHVNDQISPATDPAAPEKTSDIVLATVELAVDSQINERVSAHVAFLYEEDSTDFGIDEGTITLGLGDSMAVTAGKMYVPFGRFDSFMISDPQTLVMAETVETVLMFSAENNGVYGFAYLFNGDSDEASSAPDNDGISAGFNLGYAREGMFDVGVTYISNIGDTDTLQGLETTGTASGVVDASIAGASAYFSAGFGKVTVVGEHVMALDSFNNGDLDGTVSNKEQPSASNLEVGFDVADGITLAAAYQKTAEALFIGLPETVISASVAYEVMEGATLSAEYATMEDYATSDGGTGESANSFTMQLAVEF
jgi:hypothetical protein